MARPYIGGSNAAIESKTAAYTIGPSDHGKTFIVSGGAVTISLPTLSSAYKGFECSIIASTAHDHVVNGGASLIYGSGLMDGDKTQFYTAKSVLTLTSGSIGDSFNIKSDGEKWYCLGQAQSGVTSS